MFKFTPLSFNTINDLNKYVSFNDSTYTNNYFFSNYSVYLLDTNTKQYFLRIEKNIGFFKKPEIIGGIDLNIKNDKIKINYFMIYDKIYYDEYPELRKKELKILNDEETIKIKNILLNYTEKIAKQNNLKVIQNDTHQNLKYFNHYFNNAGFKLTNVRCNDNPFWVETYKKL